MMFGRRIALVTIAMLSFFATITTFGATVGGETVPKQAELVRPHFFWTVNSFSISRDSEAAPPQVFGWATERELVIHEERGLEIALTDEALSQSPKCFSTKSHAKSFVAKSIPEQYALFPSATFHWGEMQRLLAEVFLDGLTAVGSSPISLKFDIHLVNCSEDAISFKNIRVPIRLNGKTHAFAQPDSPTIKTNGFLLPATGRAYSVKFSARIDNLPAKKFLRQLAHSEVSPAFDMTDHALRKEIMKNSRELRVVGPRGEQWVWRVKRHLSDGQDVRLGDAISAINKNFEKITGKPFFAQSDSFITSIAAWDTGNWDLWWNANACGHNVSYAELPNLKLTDDIIFVLSENPPSITDGERQKILAQSPHSPQLLALLGSLAWNAGDRETAAKFFGKAAKSGLPYGFSWLGKYYESRTQNDATNRQELLKKAAENYKIAAQMRYAPGQAWYGRSLLKGSGVKNDRTAAIENFRLAAKQGYQDGAALYALCLIRKLAGDDKKEVGKRLLAQTARQGCATAQLGLALKLISENDPSGLNWLELAARSNDAKAQTRLAKAICNGEFGIKRDFKRSAEWLQRAIDGNDTEAFVLLGELTRSGVGVRQDDVRAAELFMRAAQLGDRDGQTWYALCLLEGAGVEPNCQEARFWLQKAADAGSPLASYLLGVSLFGGLGFTEKQPAEAVKYFKAAAPAQPAAYIFLGYCHLNGLGVKADATAAFELFKKASDAGLATGDLWLAYCYANGIGTTKNVTAARKYAQDAQAKGCTAGKTLMRSML